MPNHHPPSDHYPRALTTRCRLRSTCSGTEPSLNPTVSDKQSSELRLVKISRLRSSRKHPKSQTQAEPPPNSSHFPIFLDLFCAQPAPWLSYPGRLPVQTQVVYYNVFCSFPWDCSAAAQSCTCTIAYGSRRTMVYLAVSSIVNGRSGTPLTNGPHLLSNGPPF